MKNNKKITIIDAYSQNGEGSTGMIALNFLLNCLYSMTILQNTIGFFFFF